MNCSARWPLSVVASVFRAFRAFRGFSIHVRRFTRYLETTTLNPASKPGARVVADLQRMVFMVRVYVFNREGKLVGPVDSPRVEMSDEEWQRRLTPTQYRILRNKGTEPAFCGTLLDNKQSGVYYCLGCKLPLFSSSA